MKNKDFDNLFRDLDFDIEEPNGGHRDRFSKKLKNHKTNDDSSKGQVRNLWINILSVAASLLVVFFVISEYAGPNAASKNSELASISPEMKQTQDFYTGMIRQELIAMNAEKTPETEVIIKDALIQMKKLEKQYANLKSDLVASGKDNRVIHAMIQNFQQRIDLLNDVLKQIREIKTLNTQNHENTII